MFVKHLDKLVWILNVWLNCKDRWLYIFGLLNYNSHWFSKVVIFALSAAPIFSLQYIKSRFVLNSIYLTKYQMNFRNKRFLKKSDLTAHKTLVQWSHVLKNTVDSWNLIVCRENICYIGLQENVKGWGVRSRFLLEKILVIHVNTL